MPGSAFFEQAGPGGNEDRPDDVRQDPEEAGHAFVGKQAQPPGALDLPARGFPLARAGHIDPGQNQRTKGRKLSAPKCRECAESGTSGACDEVVLVGSRPSQVKSRVFRFTRSAPVIVAEAPIITSGHETMLMNRLV